jgi:cytoskeleton protein RodZ
MDEFGVRLKHAREAHGVSLRQIAGTTKISVAALEALERNDFSRLPGGIFSRAFIRAYAGQVGLDPEATVQEYLTEIARQEREAARNAPRPEISQDDLEFLERQKKAGRILRLAVVLVVVVILVLLIWKMRGGAPQTEPGSDTAGGQDASRSSQAPAVSVTRVRTEAPAAQTSLPVSSGASPAGAGDTAAASPAPGGTAPAPVAPRSVPADAAANASGLAVEFSVTGDCWVQASADGRVVVQRLFQAGERQRVSADAELVLDVGNAGAFAWSINGRPAKALGGEGAHKRARITPATIGDFIGPSAP